MTDAEILVIGAGPAGSLAALLLARAGRDVLLVDRSAFPREKPCGDCLSAQAAAILARHDVLDDVLACAPAQLHGWRIAAPDGSCFTALFSDLARHDAAAVLPPALALERSALDAVLVRAAAGAGVRMLERTRVVRHVVEDGRITGVECIGADGAAQTLTAQFVIAADGLRSVVARSLHAVARAPRLRKVSLTTHVDGACPTDAMGEMHVGDGVCIGIAPVRAALDRWNLTIVAESDRFAGNIRSDGVAFVNSVLARARALPRIELSATAKLLASGPFDAPMRTCVFPGAALAGDAAGYFDPFTGQGVHHALHSAELLAHHVLHTTHLAGAELHGYEHALRAAQRELHMLQRFIDAVLRRPSVAIRAIRRLNQAPLAARTLLAVTTDLAPARSLLQRDVLTSLLFPRTRRAAS